MVIEAVRATHLPPPVVVAGWHKMPMWQMHITPNLWPLKCSGQGGERWNLC